MFNFNRITTKTGLKGSLNDNLQSRIIFFLGGGGDLIQVN